MPKTKIDETTYNGTYQMDHPKHGKRFCRVQWYPGLKCFYIILMDDPGLQGTTTLRKLRKMIKEGWVKNDK